MIRIEITKTMWQGETGVHEFAPVAQDGVMHVEQRQVLLVQEFDVVNLGSIVALLNQLQQSPLCVCGHRRHEGRCQVDASPTASYGTNATCDCRHYETRGKAEYREFREQAEKKIAILTGGMGEVSQQRDRLLDDIAKLTRRHENLLRRRKKTGAKRR